MILGEELQTNNTKIYYKKLKPSTRPKTLRSTVNFAETHIYSEETSDTFPVNHKNITILNALSASARFILKTLIVGSVFYWTYKWDIWGDADKTSRNTIPKISKSVNNSYQSIRSLLLNVGMRLPKLTVKINGSSIDEEHIVDLGDECDENQPMSEVCS